MVTPVNERVKKYRERQRQAHPQEPLWHTLIGRLYVADLWLTRKGAAPASFIEAVQSVAEKLGLKITEEPPTAAEEPYQPKGVSARVSAIFEPLVDQLIAQLPARSQPKFRRNLDKFLADLQRDCQRLVRDEIADGVIERRDRWVASTAFATTCDPEEVNRDTQTALWNFYREMRRFKKLMSAQRWQDFREQFDDLIELIGNTCQINLPAELDKRLAAQKQAKMEDLDALLEKLNKGRISGGKDALSGTMTEEEFRLIRGLLHPDKHPEEERQRYTRAFEVFNRLG